MDRRRGRTEPATAPDRIATARPDGSAAATGMTTSARMIGHPVLSLNAARSGWRRP